VAADGADFAQAGGTNAAELGAALGEIREQVRALLE